MTPRRLRAYLYLLIVVIIWGIASSVIKFTQVGIATLPFLTYRFFLAGLFGVIFFAVTRTRLPKNPKDFFNLCLYGILTSAISLGFLFLGLERTTVVEANLITATSPLIVSVVCAKFLREHITNKEKLGLTIAFIGTILVILRPLDGASGSTLGNFFILIYVLSGAWAAIIGKKLLRKGVTAITLTNFSFIISFAVIAALAVYQFGLPSILHSVETLPLKYQLGVWYMAFISGTLAYTLANAAQKTIEVSESAVFSYLIPVFGVPVAILWLGEQITPTFVLGAIIIGIGVFIAEWKRRR